MIEKLIDKYVSHFNENFPIYLVPSEIMADEKALENLISKSIETNTSLFDYFQFNFNNIY